MAPRSQRNKIRFQALKAMNNIDRAIENIRYMDDLSLDRSDVLKKYMPVIVLGLDTVKQAIEALRANC